MERADDGRPRTRGYDKVMSHAVTLKVLRDDRSRLQEFTAMSPLDVWYDIIDSDMCGWALARGHTKLGLAP